jgi:SAM-dependent methyltransferase
MSNQGHSEYVLGTDDAELQRLAFQHRLWSDLAHTTWRHAGIAPGQTVLDVGSGPGFGTFDLAQIVGPAGKVIAVDESQRFIDWLRDQAHRRGITNIEAHAGDVQDLAALGIVPASIDLAYARWVLCFVPSPQDVLAGVAAALKPGGRFAVNDYFNYEAMTLAPRDPAFSKGIAAVGASWRQRGGDPDIVARLPRLAVAAGMRVTHLEADQRAAFPSQTMWHWPDSFWRNYVPRLVESGHLSAVDADAFFEAWRRAGSDPNAFMLMPTVFEFIARK